MQYIFGGKIALQDDSTSAAITCYKTQAKKEQKHKKKLLKNGIRLSFTYTPFPFLMVYNNTKQQQEYGYEEQQNKLKYDAL